MQPDADLDRSITDLARSFAEEHHAPSVVWGVVEDGRLTIAGGAGSLDDGSVPTSSTVYRIASMTKSFTAATVLALRDEGVLRLDDPITTHVPEFAAIALPTPDAAPIRLADLLSMSAGFATDDVWADRHLDLTEDELDAIVVGGIHFAVDPATAFEYSNLGFALIGRIVGRATGSTVQEHVRQRFVEPLGMRRTTWVQPTHDDWAHPYRWQGGTLEPEVLAGDGLLAPMGGLWSCVDDLAIWTRWFDEAFPASDLPDGGPLRRASRREMQQMHRYAGSREIAGSAAAQGYGYGLLLRDDPVVGPIGGHSGGLPGYGSNMRWTLGRRRSVIALANVTYAPAAVLTLDIFHALERAGRVPKVAVAVHPELRRAAEELVTLLDAWDDERAAALFTDNVARDEPFERRRARATELIGEAGPVRITGITVSSAAGADVLVEGPNGSAAKIELELSPLVPVRIESFSIDRS